MSRRNAMRDYTTADILNTPIARGGILPLTEYADRSEFDMTSGLTGAFYDALTAPARAYRGELPEDQQIPEAFNFAGSLTLGSLLAPRPAGSIGMGGRAAKEALDMSEAAPLRGYRGVNVGQEFGAHPEFGSDVIFASKSPSVASEFAFSGPQTAQTAPAVYPVDMKFRNPYVHNARGQMEELDSLAETAKELGHDGLIVRNVKDTPDMRDDAPITDIYAALQPGTTYSATTGDLLFANAKTGAAVPLATRALEGQQSKGITAYHGSPHDFDRFSMEHIGTGEGAQAYGHGLYFAESEGVAKSYKELAKDRATFTTDPEIAKKVKSNNAEIARLTDDLERAATAFDEAGYNRISDAISKLEEESAVLQGHVGHMYEVRINADPEDFLDWDKPLSQQSEKVRGALQGIYPDGLSGGDVYQMMMHDSRNTAIARGENAATTYPAVMRKASDDLRAFEIPGIRYLDQLSRGAGEGSSNYVLFDDALIEILRKYGWLGPVGAGTMANAMSRDREVY